MLRRPRRTLLFAILFVASCQAVDVKSGPSAPEAPTNVILFIADGMGPASVTMARDYLRHVEDGRVLALDAMLSGSVRTYSTTSRVTDSAAGATAYSAGVKTYSGAIAVDTLEQPVGTLVEAAIVRGMATGIVTTTSITHATPAAFSAHVPDRGMEQEIAAQQIDQGIDVLLGGGSRFFLPDTEVPGVRVDGRNLLEEAAKRGYHVVRDRNGLSSPLQRPVLGLFADEHLPYEIDRDEQLVPSLAEMTRFAIGLLRQSDEGFLLVVEGGRIDHAAHGNDAAAHLSDVLAYDQAVAEAVAFAREHQGTLVVATSDHETGGLTLGRRIDGASYYEWHPGVLEHVTGSHDKLKELFVADTAAVADFLRRHAGFETASEVEIARFDAAHAAARRARDASGNLVSASRNAGSLFERAFAETISRRALLGWTSGGHTAVDVNLYAFGPGSERFVGHFDNSEIGRIIAGALNLDLSAVTRRLRSVDS